MGTDPASFMYGLFYYYEDDWIQETKRKNLVIPPKIGSVFRFIDDLTAIDDGGEFRKTITSSISSRPQVEKGKHITFVRSL